MAAAAKQITGGSKGRFRFSIREEDPLGLIPLLGSRVGNTLPIVGGSSKSGERGGGDWDRDIARGPATEGAWLGFNTATRPEAARRIIPIEELIPIIREGLIQHNARPGRDTQNCEGRFSFDEVFAESYPKHAHRKPTPEQLRLCMLAAENVTCRKIDGAVELYKNIFWSHVTSALAGKRIVARFDPEALHQSIFIYSLDGKFIGEAECRLPEGFDDVDAARTHNRLRRQNLKHHKEIVRNARTMTALELAAQLPTTPEPEPISNKVVRLFRPPIEAPRVVESDWDNEFNDSPEELAQ
jgi:putative transposase